MQRKRLVSLGMAGVSFLSLLSMAVPNNGMKGQGAGPGPVIKPPAVESSKLEGVPKVVTQEYLKKSSIYNLEKLFVHGKHTFYTESFLYNLKCKGS